jgi:esterase/lipase superfamily enzyme
MNERYIKWYTPWLSREFEMLVFGYGGGLPLIIFPTSFGRYYQNKDFGLTGSVSSYVDAGKITLYCPDAIDLESFYNKSIHPADRMRTHNAYENVMFATCSISRDANAIPIASRFVGPASALTTPRISRFVTQALSVISSA